MHDDLQRELERDFRRETRRNWAYEHKAFLIILAMMLVAMGIGALVTYMSDSATQQDGTAEDTVTTDGVAATIDKHEIQEEEVTSYVSQYRNYAGYQEDGDWATFLDGMSSDATSMRKDAIEALAKRYVVSEHARKLGMSVSKKELDQRIAEEAKEAGYAKDMAGYEKYVTKTLMYPSMDDYRADVEMKILLDRLTEADLDPIEPTELQMVIHASDSTASYIGSRTYDAVIAVPEDVTADEVERLGGIASELAKKAKSCKSTEKFLDAAKATDGCQVKDQGWSCLGNPSAAYLKATTDLQAGKASKPFRDSDGWHVVWCAETFTTRPDSTLSLSEMPEEIYRALKVDTMESLMSEAMTQYADDLLAEHDLKINPMPKGLPYDIDMDLSYYRQETADENAEEAAQSGLDALEKTTEEAEKEEGKKTGSDSQAESGSSKSEKDSKSK